MTFVDRLYGFALNCIQYCVPNVFYSVIYLLFFNVIINMY